MATDPWLATMWHANSAGVATLSFPVEGLSYGQANPVAGRVMVVHDSTGVKVACGVLTSTPGELVTVGAYPGSPPGAGARGTLLVYPNTNGVAIVGTLAGLTPSVTTTLTINSGSSVSNETLSLLPRVWLLFK